MLTLKRVFILNLKFRRKYDIFTKFGPIAFLPISEHQTCIVFSIKNTSLNKNLKISQSEFEKIILSKGGKKEPEVLYKAFRKKLPDPQILIKSRNL